MSKVASIRLSDLLPLAWSALRRNRLRTVLTVGAISFGVAVLVYLVSLGLGLEQLTVGSVLRSNALLSFTATSFNNDIKPLDVAAIEEMRSLQGVKSVLPRLSIKGVVAFANQRAAVTVMAVDSDYLTLNEKTPVIAGRPFGEGETNSMLVTSKFLEMFGLDTKKAPLVTFDLQLDKDYGTIPVIMNVVVRGVVDDSAATAVYVPRAYIESLLGSQKITYEHTKVLVSSLDNIQPATDAVIAHGYRVQTVVDTVDEIKRVFGYIQITLAILGLIAIAVASIGMFNTLTVSLLERTREIGIMKALGIRRSDVRRLFLSEAMMIGLLGGVTGIAIAFGLQQLTYFVFQVLALIASGTVPQLFENVWYLPLAALLFSLVIATLTGIYPSNRAAALNPIDAIRHE